MQKIALVTGASRGIGRAIALGLAQDGFDIWLNYHTHEQKAEEVCQEIRALGRECLPLAFDVTKGAEVSQALDPLLAHNVPYVLVNNAGFTKDMLLGLMNEADWSSVLNVHLSGFYHVTHHVIAHMQHARRGRIVNIASLSGQTGVPGQVNYSAAKAGVIGATKALAREVAKRGILVNCVAPGFIATELTAHLDMHALMGAIPLGRAGTAEEVANCVRFLCSDLSTYITGQVLAVNGGLYM